MTKRAITVHTVTEVTFHNMELDIPDDVLDRGETAVLKWANDHQTYIDNAPRGKDQYTESLGIRRITGVTLLD